MPYARMKVEFQKIRDATESYSWGSVQGVSIRIKAYGTPYNECKVLADAKNPHSQTMRGFATPKKSKAAVSIAAALQSSQRQDDAQSQSIRVSLPWETAYGREKLAVVVPHVLSEEECRAIIPPRNGSRPYLKELLMW